MAVASLPPIVGAKNQKRVIPFARWRGCVTAREKVSLEPNELGPDSSEFSVNPVDGRLIRRGGSQIVLDTAAASQQPTVGALEGKFTALGRAHQFIPLHSPSFTANGEAGSWIVCDEANKAGTLVWMDPDGGTFRQIGLEFDVTSSGHYRQDGAAGEVRFKMIPQIAEASGIDYHRCHSVAARKYPLAGVRRAMELASGFYSPGSQSAPRWWSKRRNPTGTTGTQKLRDRPWWLDFPLWAPTTNVGAPVAGKSTGNWLGGNRFYEAWAFKFADGSIGPPFRISTSATTPAKGGLITVGTAVAGPNYYFLRIISGIPLGPKEGPAGPCVARIGYRSLQKTSVEELPDAGTLYPFTIIEDNVSTSMLDYNGSDDGLTTQAEDLLNHTAPPRAQYAVAVNGRTLMGGKIRQNPYAIVIAPTGAAASRDLNLEDENTTGLYGSTDWRHVRITTGASGHLYLSSTAPGSPNVTGTVDIDFATYTTLQLVVDKINETLFGGAAKEWAAQLVPGVDGNVPSQYLRTTSNTGDDGVTTSPAGSLTGTVRAYCPTFYFAAAFTEAYLATLPTDEAGIWLSDSDSAGGNGRYATFRIRLGDRIFPPAHGVGKLMGIEPCTGLLGTAAIVFYERGRFALRNIKGGGSGSNADYLLWPLDTQHGCISHLSCFSGPGYAGCVGQDGLWVTEGPGSALNLSRDHYNQFPEPGQLAGDFAYAINTDAVLAAAGSDTYTWAGVVGDRIRVRYRSLSVAGTYQDSGLDYPFAEGPAGAGLAVLRRDTGELYGWCCPVRAQKVGVQGIITDSNGRHCYAWGDTDSGSTGTGVVQEVDKASAANDNGTAFTSNAYTACMMSGDYMEIGICEAEPAWRKNQGTTDCGMSVTIYGDVDRSVVIRLLTLGSTGSSVLKRQRVKIGAGGNQQCVEAKITDDGSGTGAVDFRGIPLVVEDKSAETRYS